MAREVVEKYGDDLHAHPAPARIEGVEALKIVPRPIPATAASLTSRLADAERDAAIVAQRWQDDAADRPYEISIEEVSGRASRLHNNRASSTTSAC